MFSTIDLLLSAPPTLIYLVVAALVFAESAALVGLVLPGETALVAGGILTATGHASLPVLLLTATVAAVAGDTVGYRVGRRLGPAARTSRLGMWVGADRWARGEDLLTRHAVLSVVGGRWVGVLRPLIPVVAGITAMPARRYATLNAAGGALWVGVTCTAAHVLGASLSTPMLLLVMTGAVTTATAAHAVISRRRRATTAPATVPATTVPVAGLALVVP